MQLAWLDPICEGERVKQTPVGDLVARSGEIVLSLGPPWRAEEVAYVRACLDPTRPLPPLRRVPYDGTLQSIYELTHVVFYATDLADRRLTPAPPRRRQRSPR